MVAAAGEGNKRERSSALTWRMASEISSSIPVPVVVMRAWALMTRVMVEEARQRVRRMKTSSNAPISGVMDAPRRRSRQGRRSLLVPGWGLIERATSEAVFEGIEIARWGSTRAPRGGRHKFLSFEWFNIYK